MARHSQRPDAPTLTTDTLFRLVYSQASPKLRQFLIRNRAKVIPLFAEAVQAIQTKRRAARAGKRPEVPVSVLGARVGRSVPIEAQILGAALASVEDPDVTALYQGYAVGVFEPHELPDVLGIPREIRGTTLDDEDRLDLARGALEAAATVRDGKFPPYVAEEIVWGLTDWITEGSDRNLLVPVPWETAAAFVREHHSALPKPNKRGFLFAYGIRGPDRALVAVAIANTPTGRALGQSKGRPTGPIPNDRIVELTRVAVDGESNRGKNAASMLTAAVMETVPRMGRYGEPGELFVTYSLAGERGTPYRALRDKGLRPVAAVLGGSGSGQRRGAKGTAAKTVDKIRWEAGPAALPGDWSLLETYSGAPTTFAFRTAKTWIRALLRRRGQELKGRWKTDKATRSAVVETQRGDTIRLYEDGRLDVNGSVTKLDPEKWKAGASLALPLSIKAPVNFPKLSVPDLFDPLVEELEASGFAPGDAPGLVLAVGPTAEIWRTVGKRAKDGKPYLVLASADGKQLTVGPASKMLISKGARILRDPNRLLVEASSRRGFGWRKDRPLDPESYDLSAPLRWERRPQSGKIRDWLEPGVYSLVAARAGLAGDDWKAFFKDPDAFEAGLRGSTSKAFKNAIADEWSELLKLYRLPDPPSNPRARLRQRKELEDLERKLRWATGQITAEEIAELIRAEPGAPNRVRTWYGDKTGWKVYLLPGSDFFRVANLQIHTPSFERVVSGLSPKTRRAVRSARIKFRKQLPRRSREADIRRAEALEAFAQESSK